MKNAFGIVERKLFEISIQKLLPVQQKDSKFDSESRLVLDFAVWFVTG